MGTSTTGREKMMYINILIRDLKRKKTMNIILLLFTIMASIFAASGLNNVITVMNGTDYYFEKAGLGDYVVMTQNGDEGVMDVLKSSDYVKGYRYENCCWGSKDDIKINGEAALMKNNTLLVQSIDNGGIKFFQKDNTELTKVNKGEVYLTAGFLKRNDAEVGDKLSINLGDVSREFKIAGEFKDALFGSDLMGNIRFIVNDEDYNYFAEDKSVEPFHGAIFYVDSDDCTDFSAELSQLTGILHDNPSSMIKLSYVMDMIIAMIVMVLSICLNIVSFVIIKFVITFTINEEYREIGVMKAIGIRNFKIRSLYVIKYFFMALVGGSLGLVLSIPFGNMLLASVSGKMVLGNDSGILLNIIGALVVMCLMVGVSYLCTGKVKKSTPVDAIRNGQTGERYKKKNRYSLTKAHSKGALYMAINDVLSAPRRFLTIVLSFMICSVFVFGLVLVADTMKSKNLIKTFGKEADIYITDAGLMKMDYMCEEGSDILKETYKDIEKDLADKGMPASVSMEVWYRYNCEVDGNTFLMTFQQNTETEASEYEYTEGTAPQDVDEIAITQLVSDKIGAKIGDTVTIDLGTEKMNCIVTAYFQTMNQLGNVIRLHEDVPTSMKYSSGMMAYQIDFDDNPSDKEIDDRIEEIKKIYDIEDIFDGAGYCADCVGVADTMDMVAKLLLVITCIVVILVSILMERSFISNEKGQIALLKAIGFSDKAILRWHIYRFMIVGLIAELTAVILTIPVSKLWCDPIWKMMGATDVKYCFNPVSQLVVYPGIILIITLVSVTFTAVYTKKIKSRDIVNIE